MKSTNIFTFRYSRGILSCEPSQPVVLTAVSPQACVVLEGFKHIRRKVKTPPTGGEMDWNSTHGKGSRVMSQKNGENIPDKAKPS